MSTGLSFVFPFFNKATELPKLEELIINLNAHAKAQEYNCEFLIVNDGSKETDCEKLNKTFSNLQGHPNLNIRLLNHGSNLGKGAALQTGSAAAIFDTLIWCDADAAFILDDVWLLAQNAIKSPDSLWVANRKNAIQNSQSFLRKLASNFFRKLCKTVLNVPCYDIQAGLKAVPAKWFNQQSWRNKGFALDVELLREARSQLLQINESSVSIVNYFGNSSVQVVRTAFQLIKELLGPLARWPFLLGLLMVLIANTRSFSTNSAVNWDARDEMFFYFRWMGSAARAGFFPDWIPNIVSGYPIGANPQAGLYNPLYWLFFLAFPDSVLSINLLYLFFQLAIFSSAFILFYCFRFNLVLCLIGALSVIANGFVTAHASHFSYLSTYWSWLLCFLGLAFAQRKHSGLAFMLLVIGSFHMATTGYPALWISGAQVFILVWLFLLIRHNLNLRQSVPVVIGGILGLVLAIPALWHFTNQLALWPRREGVGVEELLANALPKSAFWNFWWPYMDMGSVKGRVDFTMDRFHNSLFLAIGFLIALLSLFWSSSWRKKSISLFIPFSILGFILAVLSSGDNWGFSLKRLMAENLFFHRVSRFPSGEFRGFALLALSLASLSFVAFITPRFTDRVKKALLAFAILDFFIIMAVTLGLRFMRLPEDMRGKQVLFQIVYELEHQFLIDAPRGCPFDKRHEFDQRLTPPNRFSWNGYTNLYPEAYSKDREFFRWALCGSSRLWNMKTKEPHPYDLIVYSPSEIIFNLNFQADDQKSLHLLWADVTDGFWQIEINGKNAAFAPQSQASMRSFFIQGTNSINRYQVRMTYNGPLSRLWR